LHSACLSRHCLASDKRKTGRNCSWHDFALSILTSRIAALCLYGAIQLCTKHMAGFLASSETSPSPEQMEFCGNILSKWNFKVILFGRLLTRIAEYLLSGSPIEVKFHSMILARGAGGGSTQILPQNCTSNCTSNCAKTSKKITFLRGGFCTI
jgi:hypothetical protein